MGGWTHALVRESKEHLLSRRATGRFRPGVLKLCFALWLAEGCDFSILPSVQPSELPSQRLPSRACITLATRELESPCAVPTPGTANSRKRSILFGGGDPDISFQVFEQAFGMIIRKTLRLREYVDLSLVNMHEARILASDPETSLAVP